jgi:MtaA/CmuA family methyltransferase
MQMTPKERLYAIINGQTYDRPAVTPIFMAWAAHFVGRTYRDYYLDGDVLAEAHLAVTRAFNLDQISAISDPWREASAYGMEFEYPPEGVGKPLGCLIQDARDIDKIDLLDPAKHPRMKQRIDSIGKMAQQVGRTHSVLGWVEGPLAEYADLRGLETALIDLMDKPELFEKTAKTLVQNAVRFAQAQIEAGADMIGIGDAAASLIGANLYQQHVFAFEKMLIESIRQAGATVKLHICGNISTIVAQMAKTGANIIDVDWMVPLTQARQQVGTDVVLCGNLDPSGVLLQGTPETIRAAARTCIQEGGKRFILMPGCEVPPGTPEANIRAFCSVADNSC